MAIVRWVGKGFKLAGNIMSSDAFDEWIETTGKDLLQNYAEQLTCSWFRGQARAKKKLYADIGSTIDEGSPFRSALDEQLNRFPGVVDTFASHSSHVPALIQHYSIHDVVVVPRQLVRDIFTCDVVSELKNSRELARFTGFPEGYLRRISAEAENAAFHGEIPESVTDRCILVDIDKTFPWPDQVLPGHYYIVYGYLGFNIRGGGAGKKRIKSITAGSSAAVDALKARLGKWSEEEIQDAFAQLCDEASVTFEAAHDSSAL